MNNGNGNDLPDYQYDPVAYELEEHARPDEMLMLKVAGDTGAQLLDGMQDAWVLDLCCGTGLSLEHLVDHPNVARIVGVDKCAPYLEFATERFRNVRTTPEFILADAVEVNLPWGRWDVIMLCSAYHHIEDERKVRFMSRVNRLLSNRGQAVVAENILPDYTIGDRASYAQSVKLFYTQVLEDAKRDNPDLPEYVEKLIWRVAQYGYDADYEYKVSYPIFMRDLETAKLEIAWQKRVWPDTGPLSQTTGGNYVLRLRASAAGNK